ATGSGRTGLASGGLKPQRAYVEIVALVDVFLTGAEIGLGRRLAEDAAVFVGGRKDPAFLGDNAAEHAVDAADTGSAFAGLTRFLKGQQHAHTWPLAWLHVARGRVRHVEKAKRVEPV